MSDYLGGEYISSKLLASSSVTDLVSTNIFNDSLVPQSVTSTDTINFYRAGPYDGGLEYFEVRWSLSCRSKIESTSYDIGWAAFVALSRVHEINGDYTYFVVCDMLPTIPPQNEEDSYNTPVECRVRRRKNG